MSDTTLEKYNSTSGKLRTRFAPSPTGYVHVGSLRAALFSHLLAKHVGGVSILRIEDTDQNRLVEGALENLVMVLHNLGIDFDEGYLWDDNLKTVKEKGEYGPYLQSNRLDIYQKYAKELLEKNVAYYCYCSSERLDELRKEQVALKKPPMYDRLCRELSEAARADKLQGCLAEGRKPVIRMKIPTEGQTTVEDLIYGQITYDHKVLDDQVIIKSDGFPTYHLAVVVDDHLMEITHVIRGEEWLPSTPKHLLLYSAFGWQPTKYAHTPLILNPDKSKLSKRQGDVAVEDFLKKGYLKEALINFVAFLGWNPKTEKEIYSLEELIQDFDLAKINKSGAVFDINKLDWINAHYIRSKTNQELVTLLKPFWKNLETISLSPRLQLDEYLSLIVDIEKDRLKKLSDIDERTSYYFQSPKLEAVSIVWKKSDKSTTKKHLEAVQGLLASSEAQTLASPEQVGLLLEKYITDTGTDKGTVLWPIRYALSGLSASPSPFELIYTLASGYGVGEVVTRLKVASELLVSE